MITITPLTQRHALLRPGTVTFQVQDSSAPIDHNLIIVTSSETTSVSTTKVNDGIFDVNVNVFFTTNLKVSYKGTEVSTLVAVLPSFKYDSGNHYIAPFGRTGLTITSPGIYAEKGAFGIDSRAEKYDSTIRVIPSRTWNEVVVSSITYTAITSTDININAHGLSVGDMVRFVGENFTFNGVPAYPDQAFFVISAAPNSFKVSNLPGGEAAVLTLPTLPITTVEEIENPGSGGAWNGAYYNPLYHDGSEDIKHLDDGRVKWDDVQYRWDKDSGKYRMVYGQYWYYPQGSDVTRGQFWVGANPHDYHPPVFRDSEEYRWNDRNHKYMKISYKVFYNPAIPDDQWEFTDIDLIDGALVERQVLEDLYATHPEYVPPSTDLGNPLTQISTFAVTKFSLTDPNYGTTLYVNYELDIIDGSYSTTRTVIFKRSDDFINPGADTTISDINIRHSESDSTRPNFGIPFKLGGQEKRGSGTCGTSPVQGPIYIRIDGSIPFTGNQSMDDHRLTNLADGMQPNDAVNLGQVMDLVNRPYTPAVTTTAIPSGNTATVGAASGTVCKWIYKVYDLTTFCSGEILAMKNGTVTHTEYGILGNDSGITFGCTPSATGIDLTLQNQRSGSITCETTVISL